MIYFKRLLWLVVWSVWLWLGFGLYRELPRALGPVVRRLWDEGERTVLGFVGQSDLVATITRPGSSRTSTVEVFDVTDGRRLHSIPGPPDHDPLRLSTGSHVFAGEFFAAGSSWDEKKKRVDFTGLHVLNLTTGAWRSLTKARIDHVSIHPTRPLIAFLDRTWPTFVVLMNLQTGERLFEHELPTRFMLEAPAFFLGDEHIVLPLQAVWNRDAQDSCKFEIYQIANSKEPVKSVFGPRFTRLAASATSGRIALTREADSMIVDVLDLERKTVVFSERKPDQPTMFTRKSPAPIISPSGRTFLCEVDGVLWDVDRGRPLWRAGEWERLLASGRDGDFFVAENWSGPWSKLAPKIKFETLARRSVESGELLWRTSRSLFLAPHLCNAAGTLVVLKDGTVRQLPLRVNWPLFTLCQTILALPLVLLWALLRWRKRRAARREPAVAIS